MRPVNLIPPELRRGDQSPLRTGPLPYLLVGALALLLVGVTLLVLAGNQVEDREAEIVTLEREDAAAREKAESLAAYTRFRAMSEERIATVASLADSRFDWQRVMRELALVLPDDVWLVNVSATASPTSGGGGGGGASGLRGASAGPALELTGCAVGQDAVAGFVTALKDIDGVTRVGLQSSELAKPHTETAGGSGDDCRTRSFIARFQLVIAFDAAPAPAVAEGAEVPTSTEPEGEGEAEGEAEAEGGEG